VGDANTPIRPHAPHWLHFLCPEAAVRFVVSLNMNPDYGFFNLFRALNSLRDHHKRPDFGDQPSAVEEKLPQINYSLLTTLPTHQRYQEHLFRREHFYVGLAARTRCPDYNS
jgi:hypothetical protein